MTQLFYESSNICIYGIRLTPIMPAKWTLKNIEHTSIKGKISVRTAMQHTQVIYNIHKVIII